MVHCALWTIFLWKCYEFLVNTPWRHFMARENCKIKFHGFISGHEFSIKGNFNFYLVTHEFRITRDSWALNFPWKLVTEYFMGHETTEQDFQRNEYFMNSSQVCHGPWNYRMRLSLGTIFHQSKYHVFHESWIAYNGTSIGYEYGWGCAP